MDIAEAYVKAANKRILVLVHVGHSSIAECRKLAAHAEKAAFTKRGGRLSGFVGRDRIF